MSRSSVRLGALDRFFRSRTQLAAIAVLGLCILLAVGVQVFSTLSLSRVLDANWRGAYDLLVTADGGDLTTCAAGSDKLIAPNFVGFGSGGGISLAQLDGVRAIAGVGVAAPIGAVGQISPFGQEVYALVPISKTDGQRGYQISGSVTIDDGTRVAELSHGSALVQTNPDGADQSSQARMSVGGDVSQGTAAVGVAVVPPLVVSVVAIDPVAERALLGPAGDFLSPLIAIQTIDTSTVASTYAGLAKLVEHKRIEVHPEFQRYLALSPQDSPVLPMIVNQDVPQSISLTIARSDFPPISGVDESNLARRYFEVDPPTRPEGEKVVDLSESLVPFRSVDLGFPAPGVGPVGSGGFASYDTGSGLRAAFAGTPEFTQEASTGHGGCELRVAPAGDLAASGSFPRGLSGSYREQTYRSLTSLPVAGMPVAPAPVGTYSTADVDLGESDISYVPLGAYESGETQILGQVDDPGSAPSQGVLRPGISGLGITTGSAGALTTLQAATLIRGDTPIDAIRVRVAGVDHYDDGGRAKVAKVAEKIRALGLHVDVVAGSSREAVEIYVPQYTPTADGSWDDLGWVRQQWSAVDAAAKVQSALDVGGLALLVYAVGGGTLLAGTAAVLGGIARRRSVRALRDIGWTGRQALAWVGGEYLVGAGVLLAVSAAALTLAWLGGTISPALVTIVSVVIVGYCLGGLVSALLAMRQPGPPTRRGVHKDVSPVASAAAFGVKTAARTRGVTATTAITLALIGAGAGIAAGAILGAVADAGATLLAGVAVSSLLPLHLALALVGVCSGLVLAIVGRRADRARRTRSLDALTAMGWARSTVNVSLAAELGVTTILAVVLAPAAVAAVSIVAGYSLALTIPLTVLGTVLAAGVILATRTAHA